MEKKYELDPYLQNLIEEKSLIHDLLKIEDEKNGSDSRCISYYKLEGKSQPGVAFIPGFMANKLHKKSQEILKYCAARNIPCVSYDTTGFGESVEEIGRTEARFHHWFEDAREVLTRLTDGPQVVVGSSMGGWLSLLLAQELPEKFVGQILLAPAYNFGQKALDKIWSNVDSTSKEILESGGSLEVPDPKFLSYGLVPVSLALYQGMESYNLPLENGALSVTCPVRILHGTSDEIFRPETSLALVNALKADDVMLQVIKGSAHELSDASRSLPKIFEAIEELRGHHSSQSPTILQ